MKQRNGEGIFGFSYVGDFVLFFGSGLFGAKFYRFGNENYLLI